MWWLAGLGVLGLGLLMLSGCTALTVAPGPGRPHGASVRIPGHVATLVVTQEPHPPKLQPNEPDPPEQMGLLLTPLDGSAGRVIRIAGHLQFNEYAHTARIFGVEGGQLWFQAREAGAFDLSSGRVSDARSLPAAYERPGLPRDPSLDRFLTAGVALSANEWIGLHTSEDAVSGGFRPGARFYPKSRHDVTSYPSHGPRQKRRLYRGRAHTPGVLPQVESMTPLSDEEFGSGVLLREQLDGGPLRLTGPEGFVLLFEAGEFPNRSLHAARIDTSGKVLWRVNTGIGRFEQALPDAEVIVLRGEPVRVPDKFPQPMLVMIATSTGKMSVSPLKW